MVMLSAVCVQYNSKHFYNWGYKSVLFLQLIKLKYERNKCVTKCRMSTTRVPQMNCTSFFVWFCLVGWLVHVRIFYMLIRKWNWLDCCLLAKSLHGNKHSNANDFLQEPGAQSRSSLSFKFNFLQNPHHFSRSFRVLSNFTFNDNDKMMSWLNYYYLRGNFFLKSEERQK